ncbi:MAG: hypothetical protein SPL37_05935 [Prevotella sp.]|nr:hypothetical protein [Prevotella sp.]
MVKKKYTQEQQVIDALRKCGGYATLGDLYRLVDTSSWITKTPNESIRRVVQLSSKIFRIQPGLWGAVKFFRVWSMAPLAEYGA